MGGVEKSQNALVRGRQLCAQLSNFEGSLAELFRFWCCQLRKGRKSHRITSFLMWSTWKIEEVSQTSFVFDVVKFKSWGSLAELLRFWCCQVEILRKSWRIALFLMLSTLKNEGCCQVQKWRKSRRVVAFSSLLWDRQTGRQTERKKKR